MPVLLIVPTIILALGTIAASVIVYMYRRHRKMRSELTDSETGSIDAVEGVLGRINTQKTTISNSSSVSGHYTKLSGCSTSRSQKVLPDGILNAHGKTTKESKKPSIIKFSSEFFVGSKNKNHSSDSQLQRNDSGLGDGTECGERDRKKSIQNVYPSRNYKIARVNSLAPSISGSIQNGLDQYQSSNNLKSINKKSRRKNMSYPSDSGHSSPGTATCASSMVGSVINNNGRNLSQNSQRSAAVLNQGRHNIEVTINGQNPKSPITDTTDAHSHVSESLSGVSNSNNSIKSLPEFIPNYENLNVRVENNRASLKLTNYALPPLGTPSQGKHMSRIISCESDYSSGCSSMGSYHKAN